MLKLTCLPIAFFKKDFIYLFLERGKGREKEKHQCVVASRAPVLGTWPATQAGALTGIKPATVWFADCHSIH